MRNLLSNPYKYKDLFIELVKKDIKLKYRKSTLGVFWSMLNPLLMTGVLTIVFMSLFKSDIPHFPLYVMAGRVLYHFFAEATDFAMNSIHANSQLIRKVYVPKYFFPLSRVCSSFITTLFALVPIIAIMPLMDVPYRWMNLLFIIPLIYLFAISAGIGLLLASINIFFNDMKHFYSILLMLLMYMTPIFYPANIIPEQYLNIIQLNPLYDVLVIFRDVVMFGILPDFSYHVLPIIYMIGLPALGLFVFYKTQDRFIYHL